MSVKPVEGQQFIVRVTKDGTVTDYGPRGKRSALASLRGYRRYGSDAQLIPVASMRLEQLRGYLRHCDNEVRAAEDALRAAKAKQVAAIDWVRRGERDEGVEPLG